MRPLDPKHDCQTFPAYTEGPEEFYADRPLRWTRTLRMASRTPPERPAAQAAARRRARCVFLPAFDPTELMAGAKGVGGGLGRAIAHEPAYGDRLRPVQLASTPSGAAPGMHDTELMPRTLPSSYGRHARGASGPRSVEVWDSPLAIGIALAVLPPLGVTMLWASRRLPTQGKIAATILSAFFTAMGVLLFLFAR